MAIASRRATREPAEADRPEAAVAKTDIFHGFPAQKRGSAGWYL